ncbi:MAG: hypothetical protein KKH75_10120, partial [Actinobacteria bacterium]|nr:hypothetical protein [Actinomycetota bacterium]
MLWKRKWIIAAVVAIALLTAVGYLQLRAVSYASSGTIRLNAVVTSAAVSGEIGGVSIDLGDGAVLSPAVLDPAAAALGVDSATLATEVSVASDTSSRLALVTVSAVGSSPDSAQAAVNAVLTSYQSYIDSQ